MATPPKDRLDHILDFFFGSPKNVKRTFFGIAIILIIANIDQIIAVSTSVLIKITNGLINLIPALIILGVIVLLLKKIK